MFVHCNTSSVLNYKKKIIFFVPNYKKKDPLLSFLKEIKSKIHSICCLFYFLNNQQPMKISFTSSYKTYFKDNTKNYVTNYYVLVFLRSVIFFSSYNIGRREVLLSLRKKNMKFILTFAHYSIIKSETATFDFSHK